MIDINDFNLEHDLVIKMEPINSYMIECEIKSIKKAEPKIILEEEYNMNIRKVEEREENEQQEENLFEQLKNIIESNKVKSFILLVEKEDSEMDLFVAGEKYKDCSDKDEMIFKILHNEININSKKERKLNNIVKKFTEKIKEQNDL